MPLTKGMPQTPAMKAASDARKGKVTPAMKAAFDAKKGKVTPAMKAAIDARKGKPQTPAMKAASDARKGKVTPAMKAAIDARKGKPVKQTPAQKAASDARKGPLELPEHEAQRQRQAQEFWDKIQDPDLKLIWDHQSESETPEQIRGVEYIMAWRSSSATQDHYLQTAFEGQQTLAQRIVQEHNDAQLPPPVAFWSLMRAGRGSRDRIYNDCGPNAPNYRRCPIEQEQYLFNTLQHIMQRGNTAIILQRGLDGLTNSDSLEEFLRY